MCIIEGMGAFALFAYGTLANHPGRVNASLGNVQLTAAGIGPRTQLISLPSVACC